MLLKRPYMIRWSKKSENVQINDTSDLVKKN